jgi:hypothetical protein
VENQRKSEKQGKRIRKRKKLEEIKLEEIKLEEIKLEEIKLEEIKLEEMRKRVAVDLRSRQQEYWRRWRR